MRTYISHQEVLSEVEFIELAYGIDRELFVGVARESSQERAARLDAARDVLDDLRERGESDDIAAWDALYAEQVTHTVPMLRSAARHGYARRWTSDAA